MVIEVDWIRTNDGFPTDLQSAALTTQPLPPFNNKLAFLDYMY